MGAAALRWASLPRHRIQLLASTTCAQRYSLRRGFHSSPVPWGIRSQVLKDVGEGITEVQVIQWYVEEGARIEEWKPLCQYQSDKAVDDITSRYEGVIKRLHFQADDTVPTGMALCDIEVDDAKYPESAPAQPVTSPLAERTQSVTVESDSLQPAKGETQVLEVQDSAKESVAVPKSGLATLATPAVRGMLKEHGIDITEITGSGKDARVMKEDVQKFIKDRESSAITTPAPATSSSAEAYSQALTPIQAQMFKTMTKSLAIPHFLYADEVDVTRLSAVRQRLNSTLSNGDEQKLSYLPFIIKAVSLALNSFPLLNARVDTTTNPNKPCLTMRPGHNIGVAMDTPSGLLVPNIKNVQTRSIREIATELSRLADLARAGKLTPNDLSGGTITVSNIGSIGGTYVAPVLVPSEVAILGVGRKRTVPVFDADGKVAPAEVMAFSWSADHRVVDGATMARMGATVTGYIESPESMTVALR